jgi:hypothetical protein
MHTNSIDILLRANDELLDYHVLLSGHGVRTTLIFQPNHGFASARDVVEAIARNEHPELGFLLKRKSRQTVRQVMTAYQIEETIGHRPDFSDEEARLSTDEKSIKTWRRLNARYSTSVQRR